MGRVTVIRPGDVTRTVYGAGDVYTFLATGDDTDNNYSFVHALVPPGGGPPPHIHTREDEGFYILQGELVFRAGGQLVIATPRTFLHVPRGIAHHFKNESSEPARLLIWFTPAGIEAMMEKMATDPDNYVAIGKQYGVEFVEEA